MSNCTPPDSTTPGPSATLLVIGGGIAGASVCFFAARRGWAVTLIDAGQGRASDVPTALLNLVRGQSGKVDIRALAGLHLGWALIRELEGQGHRVPHGQTGVLRPLASDAARAKFEANLPPGMPHQWLAPADSPFEVAPGWPHLLFLPQGGWVAAGALVAALVTASGAALKPARASAWDAHSATLESGEVLHADAVVWCGGSVGASWGGATWGGGTGFDPGGFSHRAGSLLLLERAAAPLPVSAGVYLAPAALEGGAVQGGELGGVLGATFEAPSSRYALIGPPLRSLHWLLERAVTLSADLSPAVTGLWTGSRLSGERTGPQPGGWWALAGLGSKGFLLGPLLARGLVEQLSGQLGKQLGGRLGKHPGSGPADLLTERDLSSLDG